jgi:HEAT repeat protein
VLAPLVAFLLAAAPAAPGADRGAAAAARDDAIRSYLGVIDRPVPAEAWRALGPEAIPALEAVARDPAALPSRRAVALEGLAALGGPRAEAAHLEAARGPAPRLVRQSAVRGLGKLLAPERLAVEVEPLLGDPDGSVRGLAAEVLAERAPALSCGKVRARAAAEGAGAGAGAGASRVARAAARCGR